MPVTAHDGMFIPNLTPMWKRITLGINTIPQRLREARTTAWYHVKLAPSYVKFIFNYTTDPDEDSVVPSLILFYALCFIDGVYNAFTAKVPTQVLEQSLEHHQYRVFIWITMVAPLLTLLGIALRGGLAWTGAVMRLCGDVGVAGVLTTFIAAVAYTSYWGQGNFSATWVIASALGSYVFVIRDLRRLADRDRWEVVK